MNYVQLAPMYLCSAGIWILNQQGLKTKKKEKFIQGGLVNKGGHLVLNPGMPAPTPVDFPLTQALLCIMLAAPFIY